MVSFQRGQMDSSGRYRGTSNGCGVEGCLVLLGIFATALLIGWPFVVFHGAVAWLVEFAYVIVAGLVGLILLASKGKKGSHREAKP